MANVYLIQQDTDHLYGEYLSAAVVIANSVGEALNNLTQHLRNFSKDTGEEIVWDQSSIHTIKIGNNGRIPASCQDSVLCLRIGENTNLPPGNYNHVPKVNPRRKLFE